MPYGSGIRLVILRGAHAKFLEKAEYKYEPKLLPIVIPMKVFRRNYSQWIRHTSLELFCKEADHCQPEVHYEASRNSRDDPRIRCRRQRQRPFRDAPV